MMELREKHAMEDDEEPRTKKLTPSDYAESAKALGHISRNRLAREGSDRAKAMLERGDQEGLEAAMIVLAECCRDLIVQSPPNGADLGAILIGHMFKKVLEDYGLAVVPKTATPVMQAAWKQGWFRGFSERYASALRSAWESPNTNAT